MIHCDAYCQKSLNKNLSKQTFSSAINSAESDNIVSDFVKIDPNPFEDFIQVVMLEEGTGIVEINILSIVGKVVRKFDFPPQDNYVLNLSDLEKGIYLIKVKNGKSSCVKRILHQ